MNSRSLLVILLIIGGLCLALASRSTLTPKRGGDHVFYGAGSDFLSEEIAIANFNGDQFEDIVTTIHWDDPDCGGWDIKVADSMSACNLSWTTFQAENSQGDTITICESPDSAEAAESWARWECLGWERVEDSDGPCDSCLYGDYLGENQGAV